MPDQGLWDAAQANIAVKYDPQQAALQRQLDLSSKNTASNEQAIQGYGNAGRNIISNTFGTLYGLLGANKTDTQNALNQQLGLTNQGYDQAIQNIQGYQQNSRDYISQMAAALGQSGQGLVSSGVLEDVSNQQLGYANAAKTNYGSTLSDWIAKMGSLADMGIGSAHQSEALQKSGFESDLLNMLGQNKLAGTTQETDVINKIADLMNVRQSDLVDMYNQLTAAQWQRDMEQAKLNEQASEASASLAYQYAALNQQAAEGAANRAASGSASSSASDLAERKFMYDQQQDALNRGDTQAAKQWQQAMDERQQSFAERNQGGSPSDLASLQGSGLITNSDQANAFLYGGNTGLQNYNSGAAQLNNIFSGLNAGGGGNSGGGFWDWNNSSYQPYSFEKSIGNTAAMMGKDLWNAANFWR
jgi:hypothetical protein